MVLIEPDSGIIVGAHHEIDNLDDPIPSELRQRRIAECAAQTSPPRLRTHTHVEVGGMPQHGRHSWHDEQVPQQLAPLADDEEHASWPCSNIADTLA